MADLMQLIENYVEARHKHGAPEYNSITAHQRDLVREALSTHHAAPPWIITLRQAEQLLAFFGGHDAEVAVAREAVGQPAGLYAWCVDCPEEGSVYLGPTEVDDDLAMNGRRVAAPGAPQQESFDGFLCRAWGETDLPCAEVVRDLQGVRRFFEREWWGGPASDADEVLADIEGHDWKEQPLWAAEFEIGGVSVERVYSFASRAAATAPARYFGPAAESAVEMLLSMGYEYQQTSNGLAWVSTAPAGGVTDAMVTAYLEANDQYWRETDALPQQSPSKWRNGTAREATRVSLQAALTTAARAAEPDEFRSAVVALRDAQKQSIEKQTFNNAWGFSDVYQAEMRVDAMLAASPTPPTSKEGGEAA